MNRQSFTDANGYEVTIGTLVEYQDKRFAEVTDLTQDGDVSLLFLDGERMQTKWRTVARLPTDIASQIDAARSNRNPAGKVAGYTAQPDAKVALVNEFKVDEERLLRKLDALEKGQTFRFMNADTGLPELPGAGHMTYVEEKGVDADKRWLAVARTHFQEGFMALNRAVFQPQRIKLPEDE